MPRPKPEMHRLLAWYSRKMNGACNTYELADGLSACIEVPPSLVKVHAKFRRKSIGARRCLAFYFINPEGVKEEA